MLPQEVRCKNCNKLLAKDQEGYLEIMNGNKAIRIYQAIAVAIDCNRCGFTLDLPVNMRKKVKAGIGT